MSYLVGGHSLSQHHLWEHPECISRSELGASPLEVFIQLMTRTSPVPIFESTISINVRCAVLQHVVGVEREGCVRFNISRHCPEKARVKQESLQMLEITEPAGHAHRAVVVNERTIEAFTNTLDVWASLPLRVYVTSTLDAS